MTEHNCCISAMSSVNFDIIFFRWFNSWSLTLFSLSVRLQMMQLTSCPPLTPQLTCCQIRLKILLPSSTSLNSAGNRYETQMSKRQPKLCLTVSNTFFLIFIWKWFLLRFKNTPLDNFSSHRNITFLLFLVSCCWLNTWSTSNLGCIP